MTIAFHTGAGEPRPCDRCGTVLPHQESKALAHGVEKDWWSPGNHTAPCGLPCMGGGVKPAQIRNGVHGYDDRCPKCGPLRVLPEVVAEMRYRADKGRGATYNQFIANGAALMHLLWDCAADVLRALTEIEKLTAERDEARQLLDAALEQNRALQMRLDDAEITAEDAKRELDMEALCAENPISPSDRHDDDL